MRREAPGAGGPAGEGWGRRAPATSPWPRLPLRSLHPLAPPGRQSSPDEGMAPGEPSTPGRRQGPGDRPGKDGEGGARPRDHGPTFPGTHRCPWCPLGAKVPRTRAWPRRAIARQGANKRPQRPQTRPPNVLKVAKGSKGPKKGSKKGCKMSQRVAKGSKCPKKGSKRSQRP